jgi:predicted branched-subunit amino acid permease
MSDAAVEASDGFGSEAAAARGGYRESFGPAGLVLFASYTGFGALAHDGGWPIWPSLLSTLTVWALPAQLIMLEMSVAGAPVGAVMFAVLLSCMRFFPMTIALLPVLRDARPGPLRYYVGAQFVAMTCWAATMRRAPELPRTERLAFFIAFSVGCMTTSWAGTLFGYYGASSIPAVLRVALPFLTPLYFLLILLGELKAPRDRIALVLGGVAGPLIHAWAPQWSVLAAGLVGGTIAWAIGRTLAPDDPQAGAAR